MKPGTRFIATFLASVSILPTSVFGAAIVDDFATYADGTLVGQGSSSPGFSNDWIGGGGRGSYETISDGKLNLIRGEYGAEMSYQHQFAANSLFSADGDTVWTSFAFSLPGIYDDSRLTISFYVDDRDVNWSYGVANGQFSLNGTPGTFGTVSAMTEYRMVSRLVRSDSGPESFDIWVNPVSEGDAPTITSIVDEFVYPGATGLTYIDIHMSDYNYGPVEPMLIISDMRVGTTFADVVPSAGSGQSVPLPGVLALFGIGAFALPGGRRKPY